MSGNPLCEEEDAFGLTNYRPRLAEVFAATTRIAMIREAATVLCIGLQSLELPALVTLEIIDAAWDNDIRMHAKWQLATTIKHWRTKR